jgi:hypothetical protein
MIHLSSLPLRGPPLDLAYLRFHDFLCFMAFHGPLQRLRVFCTYVIRLEVLAALPTCSHLFTVDYHRLCHVVSLFSLWCILCSVVSKISVLELLCIPQHNTFFAFDGRRPRHHTSCITTPVPSMHFPQWIKQPAFLDYFPSAHVNGLPS